MTFVQCLGAACLIPAFFGLFGVAEGPGAPMQYDFKLGFGCLAVAAALIYFG